MANQTNLLGYFEKTVTRKRKFQSNITSYFKKNNKETLDDSVLYLGKLI